MDRKSIVVVVVCVAVLMLWYPLVVNKLYPPKPLPPGATNAPAAALTYTNASTNAVISAEAPVTLPPAVTQTNVPEQLLEVTNSNAHYTFTSYGGGLKLIELLHYPETVSARREKHAAGGVATLNTFTPVRSEGVV
jgi:YidC/Oxa1 family membrane protein insertase